jgi:hypothetical protein
MKALKIWFENDKELENAKEGNRQGVTLRIKTREVIVDCLFCFFKYQGLNSGPTL